LVETHPPLVSHPVSLGKEEDTMRVVHEQCCGLDVHQKTVVACVLTTNPTGMLHKQVRTFSTMTADLMALSDWLSGLGIEQVAMESTGVYWRPVFALLEEGRTVTLVNPRHMKAVPGRKLISRMRSGSRTCCATDFCRRASFRPPPFGNCES
jgi:hypothetical protein